MSRGTKTLTARRPMKKGTKSLARGKRMSPKRKVKHTASSKWTNLLPDRAVVIAELDRLTSLIVRARTPRCVTCKRTNRLTASHIFRRGVVDTRFDIDPGGNVVTQCAAENETHSQRPARLFRWFMDNFGISKLAALQERYQANARVETWQLVEMQAKYEAILAAIPPEHIQIANERAFRG